MKSILITVLSVFIIQTSVSAQETETLFGGDNIRHGGFGALVFGGTSVNGQFTYFRGTRGAWVINLNDEHAIHLGLAGYRTANDFEASRWEVQDIDDPKIKTNYGGFEIEYVNRSQNLFHFSIQTLIGSGNVRFANRDINLDQRSDHYFVLQPGVNLNMNVTNWFRISGGLHYRYTSGVNLEGTGNSGLSGVVSFFALRFGKF